MNETTKILLTAFTTIGGGIFLFSAQKLIFEPILIFRKTLGDVSYCLQYHAWVFHMGTTDVPKERYEKVFDELRSQTARMRADANRILAYKFFASLGWLPKYADLIEAAGRLIRISNNLGREQWDQTSDDLNTVEKLLRIDIGKPTYKIDAGS